MFFQIEHSECSEVKKSAVLPVAGSGQTADAEAVRGVAVSTPGAHQAAPQAETTICSDSDVPVPPTFFSDLSQRDIFENVRNKNSEKISPGK